MYRTLAKRLRSALIWTVLAAVVFGIILVLVYAINGKVEYDATLLESGLQDLAALRGGSEIGCVPVTPGEDNVCSAFADVVQMEVRIFSACRWQPS